MFRTRPYRRYKAILYERRRLRLMKQIWKADSSEVVNVFYKKPGRLRKHNLSCNCSMCKPHKYYGRIPTNKEKISHNTMVFELQGDLITE